MTTEHPVRIIVVGAGLIGSRHLQVIAGLAPRGEVAAVVDLTAAAAEAKAAEYGVPAFTSLAQALADTEADAVAVCTPTGLHGAPAIEALAAGKHVVIEKPAEVSLAKTDEIIAAQEASGKLVTVISQHRFDPSMETVMAAVESGEFGRLTSGVASIDWWRGQSYYDSGAWRGTWELDGGGALMNQGVHTVDLLVAALGTPVEVFAYTATLAHKRMEVEDVAVAVVKFEGGTLGIIHASTAAFPGLSARLQIHGDKGSAVIDNDQLVFLHKTAQGEAPVEKFFGSAGSLNQVEPAAAPAAAASSNPGALSDVHRRQYENFLAAVRGEEEIRIGLAENRLSLGVILGAYESARTGLPVPLNTVARV